MRDKGANATFVQVILKFSLSHTEAHLQITVQIFSSNLLCDHQNNNMSSHETFTAYFVLNN